MQVDIVDSLQEFNRLETNWNDLFRKDPDAHFFLSFTWMQEIIREYPDVCRVLAVKENADSHEYISFFPLRLTTVWSRSRKCYRNELYTAGSLFWSEYTGLLGDPAHDATAIPALACALLKLQWARLSLRYLRLSEHRRKLLLDGFSHATHRVELRDRIINAGTIDNLACPFVELPDDFDAYLDAQVGTSSRQKIRRFTRKLESSPTLRMEFTDAQTRQSNTNILLDFWDRTWRGQKGARTDSIIRKYRKILAAADTCAALFLPVLWDGDAPLGALGSVVDWEKKRLHFIIAGRDQSRNEPYIGWLLHSQSIHWAIANGLQIYDFCHGDEPYKYNYGATDLRIDDPEVWTRNGRNPADLLDSASTEFVMFDAVSTLRDGDIARAETACKQVHQIARSERHRRIGRKG